MHHHPAIAYFDLAALRHNVQRVSALSPHSKILAMVKDNAYGHGAVPVSSVLEPYVAAFGVMYLQEALPLLAAGINKPIVIMSGFFNADELQTIAAAGLQTIVHNFEQLALLDKTTLAQPLSVWCKVDTGMHRLGFQPHVVTDVYARLYANAAIKKPIRFMTHFSDADDVQKEKTLLQVACFKRVTEKAINYVQVPGGVVETSIANSSAVINWPQVHADFIRPGITLYGVSPLSNLSEQCGADLGLRPVMTLTAHVVAIHDLPKGDTVGYGSTWRCPEDMRVGIVSIGYGDGYPRGTRAGTPVLIGGVRCGLIGRVAMDMIAVDLRAVPSAKVGDVAVLWGRGLPAEGIAKGSDTIPYELFCRMTAKVHREYCEGCENFA